MIKLRVITPHRHEIDVRLHQSKLVEDLLIAVNLLDRNVDAYYQGKRMLEGRCLSDYKLPDGAHIEMRTSTSPALMSASSYFKISPNNTGPEWFSLTASNFLKRTLGLGDPEIERLCVAMYLLSLRPIVMISI